jgi:hypothetical protein
MVAPPEQNFQPQTRDTTNGPYLHTYIPRSDGSILVGGVAYVPQAVGGTVTATTVPVGTVPIAVQPAVQVECQVPLNFPYYIYQGASLIPRNQILQSTCLPCEQSANGLSLPRSLKLSTNNLAISPNPNRPTTRTRTLNITQPTFGTYGQTGSEVLAQQLAYAQASNVNQKQEMKPADDDPFRMYWVREQDGTWTQRNRLTIDSGDIGDCRWYAMDGQFYAVRLFDG